MVARDLEERVDYKSVHGNLGDERTLQYLDCGNRYKTIHLLKFIEL